MIVNGRREPIGGARRVSVEARAPLLLAAQRVGEAGLALWMGYHALVRLVIGPLGTDGRIYYEAAAAMRAGLDPWLAGPVGIRFNGPPITILPLVPFTFIPEVTAVWIWTGASAIAAWVAVRRLGLAPYWILFPPLVDGIAAANPNVVALALLTVPFGGGLASFLKVYLAAPLAIWGRWRDLLILAAAVVVTAPLLPWGLFVTDSGQIGSAYTAQAHGGFSASGWWIVPTVLALAYLGRDKAGWLVVPMLWPNAGYHYGLFALGAAHPILGLLMSLPWQGLWPPAVWLLAGWTFTSQRATGRTPRSRLPWTGSRLARAAWGTWRPRTAPRPSPPTGSEPYR